ncbi:hypothetical protein NIES2101_03710 [Calothrix sp. HK-06]|nr:hypothetical protein NIES2101_03710 [Calothrix sp. HK-06]
MTFKNFVCWDLKRVRQVMDIEATQPANHLFLATHYPITMYRQDLIQNSNASQMQYDEEQFLRDFIAEKDFAFVPVLGNSGTGKSHLIRWLAANIKSTDKRKVLLIPKIGTNLKDIITLILEGMEGEKFNEYRQRVNEATNIETETEARVQLLNQLAAEVGDNGKKDKNKLTDEQIYLVEELDSFLYDSLFREYWLRDSGIIHRLIIHILGYTEKIEIIEERRQFSLEDLPVDIPNLQDAGKKARDFYGFLIGNSSIQKATVDWLNQHLDEAVTKVLNLGREDLLRLMREVRETLAEQGIELILLIEDFAKLQGIDREVLEAVLARPQQPGSTPLCAIRTALACTTGYFEGLTNTFDTVKQRVTFSVNLDVGTVSEQSIITQASLQKFVSKYLNTVRLEDEVILSWANLNNQEVNSQSKPLMSACDECEHREACHNGFGSISGIGLYPFTPKAIEQMSKRVNAGNFNPRILIKDVLKYVLENGLEDIKKGTFPSSSLQEHFGKQRLDPFTQEDTRAKDPYNFKRRETLIDLWDDSNQLIDLSPELHTAFNLPLLGIKNHYTEVTKVTQQRYLSDIKNTTPVTKNDGAKYKVEVREVVEIQEKVIPDKLAEQLQQLKDWNNKGDLSQEIAKILREFIYPAIFDRIDWDAEMLLKRSFARAPKRANKQDEDEQEDNLNDEKSKKIFKQKNVIFYSRRKTNDTFYGVVLKLPLNPEDEKDFRETTIAFQGILQYQQYKNWKFPNGDRYFRAYSKLLDKWSQYVLDAIRLYPRESGDIWNPVPTAVELLAITTTITGHTTNSLESLINALFLEPDKNNNTTRTTSWKELSDSLKKCRPDLLEIVQSRIACTKGSSTQFQIIDTIQIIEPLEKIRKSWQIQHHIPDDIYKKFLENRNSSSEFHKLCKAYQQVNELLEVAIREEYKRQFDIYESLIRDFGENMNKDGVIDSLKLSLENAGYAGVVRGWKKFDEMTKIIAQFRRTSISEYQKTMKRVQIEMETNKNLGKVFQLLSEDNEKVIIESSDFIRYTNNFLDASILEAQNQISNLSQSGGGLVESCQQEIKEGLINLQKFLNEIKE